MEAINDSLRSHVLDVILEFYDANSWDSNFIKVNNKPVTMIMLMSVVDDVLRAGTREMSSNPLHARGLWMHVSPWYVFSNRTLSLWRQWGTPTDIATNVVDAFDLIMGDEVIEFSFNSEVDTHEMFGFCWYI